MLQLVAASHLVLAHLRWERISYSLANISNIQSALIASEDLAVVVLVCIIDPQGDRVVNSLLDDKHWLLKASDTWRHMNSLEGRRFALLPVEDGRDSVAVSDTRFWTLKVDRQSLRVPSSLGA